VVKPWCRGDVLLCRYADDFVCAFRFEAGARRFYRVLSQRLETFGLALAPEKTQVLRFSRFHPRVQRRATFLALLDFPWEHISIKTRR
jgi:RNA-directed DNA polymerase